MKRKIEIVLALWTTLLIFAQCNTEDCGCVPPPVNNEFTSILLVQADYTTDTVVSLKELVFPYWTKNFTIAKEYKSPGDFGYVKLFYSEINEMIFYGTIHWMGCGEIHFPKDWNEPKTYETVDTKDLRLPKNGFKWILNYEDSPLKEENVMRAWGYVQTFSIVRNYLEQNPDEKVKVYFYQPSVGIGNPADWKWLFIISLRSRLQ